MNENAYVLFDLPYPILIPDSMKSDNSDGEVGEIYVHGNPPVGVKTVLMSREGGNFKALGELEGGDPYGRISFTKLQVRFHVGSYSYLNDWNEDQYLEHAVGQVNLLVAHYRDIANQPLLNELSVRDIVNFKIVKIDQKGKESILDLARGRGPLKVGIDDLKRKQHQKLIDRLQSVKRPSLVREIDLSIQRHYHGGEYRLAIVEAAILFETWLKSVLKDKMLKDGIGHEEVRKKFIDNNGQPKSIWAVAENLIPKIFNFNFVITVEGNAWARNLKNVRNDIVHGDKPEPTKKEADDAIEALKNSTKIISSKFRGV